eukprot:GEMP01014222.1.p1 GENE.GEMP01014222.1~~GEMP01014222.1.p1  ORF type:complete len:466 (+),score=58.62 GEMP01014222.1:24-1400(+)
MVECTKKDGQLARLDDKRPAALVTALNHVPGAATPNSFRTPCSSPYGSPPVSPKLGPRTSISKSSGMLREILYINHPSRINDFYDFGSILGRGGFGVVSEIFHAKTFRPFAGKATMKSSLKKPEDAETFRRVLELLLNYENDYLVKLVHTFEDDLNYYVVMQKCAGTIGKLVSPSRRANDPNMPYVLCPARLEDFCRQILLGVSFLQFHNVLHRDIKPDNIMVEEPYLDAASNFGDLAMTLKIVDFDMCLFLEPGTDSLVTSSLSGTACYMAPELLRTRLCSKQSDVFSIGGTMYFLVTELTPCPGISLSSRFESSELHDMMFSWAMEAAAPTDKIDHDPVWARLPLDAVDAIQTALNPDRNKRWETADAMLNSDWLCERPTSSATSRKSQKTFRSANGSNNRFQELLMQQENNSQRSPTATFLVSTSGTPTNLESPMNDARFAKVALDDIIRKSRVE